MNSVEENSEFLLAVDYTKTIGCAIIDGNYDWVARFISCGGSPIPSGMGEKKVEVFAKLFNLGGLTTEDVVDKMEEDGYRPATFLELLALGIMFPEFQRKSHIAALGSISSGRDRDVAILFSNDSKRMLSDFPSRFPWGNSYRFLGIRK